MDVNNAYSKPQNACRDMFKRIYCLILFGRMDTMLHNVERLLR